MLKLGKPIGILGGTFDPIHYGHLRTGLELTQSLDLQEVRFIPCLQPVLEKVTRTSVDHRLKMLELAIANQPQFKIDDRELKRNAPSYTVDTLISIREENPETPLCLIIGSDAFANLNRWHRWSDLIQLAHIIVVARPGYTFPMHGPMFTFMERHQISEPDILSRKTAGYIYFPILSLLPFSSTNIRQQISLGLNARYLLPDAVLEYILREKLYSHF